MIKYLGIITAVVLACSAFAQPESSGQSQIQMPEIQAPAKPAPDQQTGLMSGNKPFSLTTDVNGELMYNFNESNELESITAKKGVVFTSEDMTLNSDQLDYKTLTSELVAAGKKVVVRQGEVIATCQLFKYFPNDQHSELSGNPVLYNKSKDGKVSTTVGDKINIFRVNGKPQVKVIGGPGRGPRLSSSGSNQPGVSESAKLIVTEPAAPGASPSGVVSGSSAAPEQAQPAPSNGSSTNILSVPDISSPNAPAQSAPKSNRIDTNNPADLQSFAGKKKQQQ